MVISTWEAIGAVDIDRRLTELGAWGLPQALPEPERATSTTKGLHRAVVELLTKRVLDGHHLAQRLQRAGRSRRPASGSEATEARIASLLTR